MSERDPVFHTDPEQDEAFMARAIALSALALEDERLRPFGSVVVRHGEIVGEGVNRSLAKNDPTSHGEVEAIRAACGFLGTLDLSDCVLYSSCEPCAMCRATTMMAGIKRVVFGASLDDSKELYAAHPNAPRAMPITAAEMRRSVGSPIEDSGLLSSRALSAEAIRVMETFLVSRSPK